MSFISFNFTASQQLKLLGIIILIFIIGYFSTPKGNTINSYSGRGPRPVFKTSSGPTTFFHTKNINNNLTRPV